MSTSKIAIVVDLYSSGALYTSKFLLYMVSYITIQSSLPVLPIVQEGVENTHYLMINYSNPYDYGIFW